MAKPVKTREPDAIDALMPRPLPGWARFLIGGFVVGVAGLAAWGWGFGYLYPRPDCCGSGSASPQIRPGADGRSVTVAARFYNSSGRTLRVRDVGAELEGARVIDAAFIGSGDIPPPQNPGASAPPTDTVPGGSFGVIAVTFVPVRCRFGGQGWGSATVRLRVDSGVPFLPEREFQVPHPIVAGSDFTVLDAAGGPGRKTDDPLATACALLGR